MSETTPTAAAAAPKAPAAKGSPKKSGLLSGNGLLLFGAAVLFGVIVYFLPFQLDYPAKVTLALLAFTAAAWVFDLMPVGVTALLFPVLLVVILGPRIMPTRTAFAGYTDSTVWLMVGAFLLGEATVQTGLAKRIAFTIMKRGGSSYNRIVLYLWIAGCVLGLLVPSAIARVAMFIPIMVGIVQAYKAPNDSNFACNLLQHVYWSSILGSTLWYTGTNMNPTAMGIAQSINGYAPSYITWVVWMVIPSITLFAGCYLIIQWVLKPEPDILANAGSSNVIIDELAAMGPMQGEEKRSLYFFILAVALWVTEPLHKVSTAWVAIIVGLLLFMPQIGILKGKALNRISWDTIILLGVALGFTDITKAVGLDKWIVNSLMNPILSPFVTHGSLGMAFAICMLVFLVHFVMASSSAETAMMTPMVARYAHEAGFNATFASMIVARTSQNVFIFPYQTLPLVVLWGTGYIDMRKCVTSMSCIALFNVAWITLLGPYYAFIMEWVK